MLKLGIWVMNYFQDVRQHILLLLRKTFDVKVVKRTQTYYIYNVKKHFSTNHNIHEFSLRV